MNQMKSLQAFSAFFGAVLFAGAAPPSGCVGQMERQCEAPSLITVTLAGERCGVVTLTRTEAGEPVRSELFLCPSQSGTQVVKEFQSGVYQVEVVSPLERTVALEDFVHPESVVLNCGASETLSVFQASEGGRPDLVELLRSVDTSPALPDLSLDQSFREDLDFRGLLGRDRGGVCEREAPEFHRYLVSDFGIQGFLNRIEDNRAYIENFFSRETYRDREGVERRNPFYEYSQQNGPVLYEERIEADEGHWIAIRVHDPYVAWNGGSRFAGIYWVGRKTLRDRFGNTRVGDLLILGRGASSFETYHYIFEDRTGAFGAYDARILNWIHYRNIAPKNWELELLLVENECHTGWMSSEYRFRRRLSEPDGSEYVDRGTPWSWTRYQSSSVFACQLKYLQEGPRGVPLDFINRKLMDPIGAEEIMLSSDDSGAYLMEYLWPVTCIPELLFPVD